MERAVSTSGARLRSAAIGGGGALLGAIAWAFAGGWIGAAGAAAAMAALGWLLGSARGSRPHAERRETTAPDGSRAPAGEGEREPETVSERNADRDWRRVESGTARPSPMEEMTGQAKRDADWLEL